MISRHRYLALHFTLVFAIFVLIKKGSGLNDKRGRHFLLSFLPLHDKSGSILLVLSAYNNTNVTISNDMFNISLTYQIAVDQSREVQLDARLRYKNHLEVERKAVVIHSTHDIVVHVFNVGTSSSDGYVALPVGTLSNKYIIAAFIKQPESFRFIGNTPSSLSAFTIAAVNNNTKVTIRFKHALSTCGSQSTSTPSLQISFQQFIMGGVPVEEEEEEVDENKKTMTFTLNQHDVIGTYCALDPTGTIIESDKPVSVVSGGICAFVPHIMMPECDHMEEMMIPVEMFGRHYVMHGLGGRPSGAIYRIIAVHNNTGISTSLGHGGELHEGQAADINLFETGPMCLITSKPSLLVMFAKGNRADVPAAFGGPFMAIVTPTERFSTAPLNVQHFWNMFQSRNMSLYVTIVQKKECKATLKNFDFVVVPPKCDYVISTVKLSNANSSMVPVPEVKYGAMVYGFGSGEGFGFYHDIFTSINTDDLKAANVCASYPCLNEGECREGCPYVCLCKHGFRGSQCEKQENNTYEPSFKDTDDCKTNPCVHGVCQDRVGAYSCECHPGFYGVNCHLDIDECEGDPCLQGNCSDHVNDFFCTCEVGFTGKYCDIDIDDCLGEPCSSQGDCMDEVGGYTCMCNDGFTGQRCQTDIDDCVNQSHACHNNGTCIDGIDSFTCMCAHGFTGTRCDNDIVECVSEPCQHGGECQEGRGTYTCLCPPGYTGSNCQHDIDECEASPCENNGNCTDGIDSFSCACQDGFTGIVCETDMDECELEPCQHNGTCHDGVNSFLCHCGPGYTGDRCQIDKDDCVNISCENNGTCVDGVNNFACLCQPGYTGDICQTDIDDCASSPCEHEGECSDGVNSFACLCQPAYQGNLCQYDASTTTSTTQTSSSSTITSSSTSTSISTFTKHTTSTVSVTTTSLATSTHVHHNTNHSTYLNNLLLDFNVLGSTVRKHLTAQDNRSSSILIAVCGIILVVAVCICVCAHDCMVYFWTPRRKIAAAYVLRRTGLRDAASTYAVTHVKDAVSTYAVSNVRDTASTSAVTNVTTVMVRPKSPEPDVEDTAT